MSSRIEKIRRYTKPEDWNYVSTDSNPADEATRNVSPSHFQDSMWLVGPPDLKENKGFKDEETYHLIEPDNDKEVRPFVEVCKTGFVQGEMFTKRFERFSCWRSLVKAVELLKLLARKQHDPNKMPRMDLRKTRSLQSYNEAEQFIIKQVQHEWFKIEIKCINQGRLIPRDSTILTLNPILDKEDMVRVGGRLKQMETNFNEKHPLIIPRKHHIAKLLITHAHEEIKHQGRHFTEGAVRRKGWWIPCGKRLISTIIHKCVRCRKLRGSLQYQQMADLPSDRVKIGAPFTSVGVDVFGPWSVVTRRTRGGQANSKRWAVLFTCLTTRAVHIELVEEMSSSSFINALRRFISIRGKVTEFRSDRGTNFIGATDDLHINTVNVEDGKIKTFLYNTGIVWIFNPPHSSHMGGVWERLIGVARRILDSLISEYSSKNLTHEVLSTFMAEVCAIINSRPITTVGTDPECPTVLSPSMLLTHKSDCVTGPPGDFDVKDIYKSQWKMVQHLANQFWTRWKGEYLNTLQKRRKWTSSVPDIQKGNVVLVRDKEIVRNEWPVGLVVNAIPSKDGKVRKAEVKIYRNGKHIIYTRPITDLILLISD